jgi:hypothetical protein
MPSLIHIPTEFVYRPGCLNVALVLMFQYRISNVPRLEIKLYNEKINSYIMGALKW